LFSLGTC